MKLRPEWDGIVPMMEIEIGTGTIEMDQKVQNMPKLGPKTFRGAFWNAPGQFRRNEIELTAMPNIATIISSSKLLSTS